MTEVSFGEWLKRQRSGKGLTREQLAHQVGCAVITLRKIEAEERRPSAQIVDQLIKIFEISQQERTSFLKFARGDWTKAPDKSSGEKPWQSPKSARTNLPTALTSFIGREKEQNEVIDLLSKNRLVTLTGAGGIGKTRLSLQVGQKLLGGFQNGTWFVELAPILEPLLVPRITAIAIGLRDEPQRPVIDMLCDYLRDTQMLIILDNCEHLIEACVSMTAQLLHAAPNVRVLASSREVLGIPGEVNYRVPSLHLPDVEHLPTIESLRQYEAITLFVERARSAVPNFVITNENVSALARICHQLDGIPLGIELAAAKVRVLTVEQIAQRLDDRFHLLTSGNRVVLERHQTLRATIDWSYNLLSPSEQILLRRLSVFVGGWTLEAAESVCADELVGSDDVLNLLEQMINKSLIITEASQGWSRYRMLETIRQYAIEKLLEISEGDAVCDKHLEYFLNLAETADPHLRRAEQVEWLKRLDAEHDNLRAALTWAMSKPSAEPGLRLAGNLGTFWLMRSYGLEGAKWLDQALSKSWNENSKAEKAARAKALYCRADIADTLDELDIGKTSVEKALALFEEVEDPWGVAYSRVLNAQQMRRTLDTGIRTSLEQSLSEFQRLGDAWGESLALRRLALLYIEKGAGAPEEILGILQRALARAHDSGDRTKIVGCLVVLALHLMNHGQWEQAEQFCAEIDSSAEVLQVQSARVDLFFACGNFEKAKAEAKLVIEYCDLHGDKNLQSEALLTLAFTAEAENDLPSAVAYAQKALGLSRKVGVSRVIAWDLILVAIFEYWQGNVEAANSYVRESLEFVRRAEVGDNAVLRILNYLGGSLVQKKTQAAVQILAFSESLAQSLAVHRDPIFDQPYFDRFLAASRAKLSEAEFTAAWEAGSKMSLEDAIELVLNTLEEA